MGIVVLKEKLTKEEIKDAREDFRDYIKITEDIKQKLVAIGGEYHADAEKLLLEKYGAKQKDIWGGGYNMLTGEFETIAIINIRQDPENKSMEIINPTIREAFLAIVNERLRNIKLLL